MVQTASRITLPNVTDVYWLHLGLRTLRSLHYGYRNQSSSQCYLCYFKILICCFWRLAGGGLNEHVMFNQLFLYQKHSNICKGESFFFSPLSLNEVCGCGFTRVKGEGYLPTLWYHWQCCKACSMFLVTVSTRIQQDPNRSIKCCLVNKHLTQ